MTQSEARELAKPYKKQEDNKPVGGKAQEGEAEEGEAAESEWDQHNRRWFKNLYKLALQAQEAADAFLECTPEKQRELLKAVDTGVVMYLRGSAKALVRLADQLTGS